MTFFGETIRKAREAKGLTTSQVADRTRILVQIIEAMEREDFKRIPAAIYGRGFVRHISEVLELDPKPLVAEFMEIYEGRKPPASALPDSFQPKSEQPAAPSLWDVPAQPEQPTASPETTDESTVVATPASIFSPELPPAAPEPDTAEATSLTEYPPSSRAEESVDNISGGITNDPQPESPNTETQPPSTSTPQPDVVKGLDLFDQPPVVQRNNTRTLWTGNDVQPVLAGNDVEASDAATTPEQDQEQIPPATRAQDIFSSAYDEAEEEPPYDGPSAAEKFRGSLSVVSHGVLGGVRRIPRSAWRMAVLIFGALAVIGLIVWGCRILYQITEQPMDGNGGPMKTIATPGPRLPSAPASNPSPNARNVPAPPSSLRSTGQKIPPLYVD